MAVALLTGEEIDEIQSQTGVNVLALIERLKMPPEERLRTALEGASNLARLREAVQTKIVTR